jgi:hypothetical protein
MKKLITLFAIAGMVLALAPAAQAEFPETGQYRIIFNTIGTYQAIPTAITTYAGYVEAEAQAAGSLVIGITGWKVIGSTVAVNARVNTDTVGSGGGNDVPIYNVNGVRVADGNAKLWATTEAGYLESNAESLLAQIKHVNGNDPGYGNRTWSGTNPDGTTLTGSELGAATAGTADNRQVDWQWVTWWGADNGHPDANTDLRLLYGMSPVLGGPAGTAGTLIFGQ